MRKNTIRITLLVLAITGGLLALRSSGNAEPAVPCEESMEQCCEEKGESSKENLLWETLSGQFFTSSGID